MNVPDADVRLVAALARDHVVAILGEVEAGKSLPAGVGDEKLPVLAGVVQHDGTPTQQADKKINSHFRENSLGEYKFEHVRRGSSSE